MIVSRWLLLAGIAAICLLGCALAAFLLRTKGRRVLPAKPGREPDAEAAGAHEELKRKAAFFEALLHSSQDGIVAIDNDGKDVFENQRNVDLWGFPTDMMERNDGEEKRRFVTGMVKDPSPLEEGSRAVRENPDLCIRQQTELKDGRTFDIYSSPVVGVDGTHLGRIYTFHDITTKKKAGDALRKSEMTLRSILSVSPIGFALLDPEGRPEWGSDGMTAITGYSSGEVKDISSLTLYETEEEYLRVEEAVYQAARRGEVGTTHTKWISKDGRVLNILLSAVALDPKDPGARLVVTARDVTIYKRAEAELRAKEERFRVLFDDSPVGLAEFDASAAKAEILNLQASGVNDLQGYFVSHPEKKTEIGSLVKILNVNKAAFDLFEVPRGKSQDETLPHLATLIRESLTMADIREVAGLTGELETELVAETGTGRKMYLFSKWIVVPGFEHSHGRIIVSFINVTRQKETEAALRAAQARLSDAAELAHMAFWELDETTKNFIFNDAFYALFGTTAEQEGGYVMAAADYYNRFIHPEDLPRVREQVMEAYKNRPGVIQIEHRFIRRDGEVRHMANRTRAKWTESGEIVYMYGANQDITDRKSAEESLQKALAELESKKNNPNDR